MHEAHLWVSHTVWLEQSQPTGYAVSVTASAPPGGLSKHSVDQTTPCQPKPFSTRPFKEQVEQKEQTNRAWILDVILQKFLSVLTFFLLYSYIYKKSGICRIIIKITLKIRAWNFKKQLDCINSFVSQGGTKQSTDINQVRVSWFQCYKDS